jgi:hypothetical protein
MITPPQQGLWKSEPPEHQPAQNSLHGRDDERPIDSGANGVARTAHQVSCLDFRQGRKIEHEARDLGAVA